MDMDEKILPLDMDHLPEFFVQKAMREINYSPDAMERGIKELKKLIAKENILKGFKLNQPSRDHQLNAFLTCRKFDVDRAWEHLTKWNKFREKHPEAYDFPSYEELSVFMTEDFSTVLPGRCHDGCAVFYINFSNWNAEQHPIIAMERFFAFLTLQLIRKPMTQVNGFKVIIDFDIPLSILKICTPSNLYLFVNGIFVVTPARFKEIHLLNLFGIGRMMWKTGKKFLPAKLKDREILPQNLGGDLKDHDMTWWLKKYLAPEEKYVYEF